MRSIAAFGVALLVVWSALNAVRAAEKCIPPPADANTALLRANWGFWQGVRFAGGKGVAQNLVFTKNYFESAFTGDPENATLIGVFYERKLKDFAKASHWFERRAAVGVEQAVGYLGFLYDNAKEHPLPDFKSFGRLRKSDDGFSAIRLGHMYLNGIENV